MYLLRCKCASLPLGGYILEKLLTIRFDLTPTIVNLVLNNYSAYHFNHNQCVIRLKPSMKNVPMPDLFLKIANCPSQQCFHGSIMFHHRLVRTRAVPLSPLPLTHRPHSLAVVTVINPEVITWWEYYDTSLVCDRFGKRSYHNAALSERASLYGDSGDDYGGDAVLKEYYSRFGRPNHILSGRQLWQQASQRIR